MKTEQTAGRQSDLDLISIINAAKAIAKTRKMATLLDKLMAIIIECANAGQGYLIFLKNGHPRIEAQATTCPELSNLELPADLITCKHLPIELVQFVLRSKKIVILADAVHDPDYRKIPYILRHKVKSILCMPVIHAGQTAGAIYLENKTTPDCFTPGRVDILITITDMLTNAWAEDNAQKEISIYQGKLRALSSEIALAQEKERRKMALGLHDHIGQSLILIKMELSQLSDHTTDPQAKKKYNTIMATLKQTIEQTRSLTFDLSSPELYEIGLEAALDALCERKTQSYHIPVSFFDDDNPKPLDTTLSILLYQATRELIFNAIKHAKASRISVSVNRNANRIQIFVKDDGIGFKINLPTASKHPINRFGLFSIQERMNHHQGSFSIESSPERGTLAVLTAPLLK